VLWLYSARGRMNRRSIRFRLTAWYALILMVTFAAAGAVVWWAIRDSIHSTVDKDLRSRLKAMRTYVEKQSSTPDAEPVAEELAGPLVLLLASAGGYWMSRRALEPVDQITRTAAEIGAYNLSQRLPLRKTGDELDRLSATLNSMFARLEAAFRQITQFTADASH